MTHLGLAVEEVDLLDHMADPTGVRKRLAGFDLVWAGGGNAFAVRRVLRLGGTELAVSHLIRLANSPTPATAQERSCRV